MLHHRSGIPGIEEDGTFGRQPRQQNEIVARIARGTPAFEPDAMHQYSNTGYVLLGYIVEKAGRKPYQDALRDRITSKLGLKNTYAGTGMTDSGRNESLSYRYTGGWRVVEELDFSVLAGAGAIVSTTADMATFIQGLFDLKLVSKERLAQMTAMRDGEGMGLEPHTFAGKTCYGHTGGSGSSGAWLTYCPEDRVALAYATNAKIYPVRNIVTGVLDVVWNRPFEVPRLEAFIVSPDVLDRYVGVYTIAGTPARMVVVRDGGTLFIRAPGQADIALEATAENRFKIDPMPLFEFDAEKGQMIITRGREQRIFMKEK